MYSKADDCLEDVNENYQNCSVLCCVRQLSTMVCTLYIWAVLKDECWFRFRFMHISKAYQVKMGLFCLPHFASCHTSRCQSSVPLLLAAGNAVHSDVLWATSRDRSWYLALSQRARCAAGSRRLCKQTWSVRSGIAFTPMHHVLHCLYSHTSRCLSPPHNRQHDVLHGSSSVPFVELWASYVHLQARIQSTSVEWLEVTQP